MKTAENAQVQVAAGSHPGMSGKNNEDRYAVSSYRFKDKAGTPSVLAIVSDGIGGHRAGEVAAEIAVKTISQAVIASDGSQPAQTLRDAIIQAGQLIYEQSENQAEQKGMGATCACGWVIGDRLYTAAVGDSRIYLIRGGAIRQLSTDHTWIQEALDNGILTPDEARGHPNAHVIRRYLGSRQPVTPDLRMRLRQGESDAQAEANQGLRLLPDDIVVLCSDGLTDLVSEAEILNAFQGHDQEAAIQELIHQANERGGHDNITIVALGMPQAAVDAVAETMQIPVAASTQVVRTSEAPVPAAAAPRGGLNFACLGVGALVAIGILAMGGLYWLFGGPSSSATPSPSVSITQDIFATRPVLQTPGTAQPTETGSIRYTATVSATPLRSPSPTPLRATLTPWPTNTRSP